MRRTKGFTLIELLVVVAIIALLISILLPSLGRARELAKRSVCAANLKGIGNSLNIYSNENSGRFPLAPHNPISTSSDGSAIEFVGSVGRRGSSALAGSVNCPPRSNADQTTINNLNSDTSTGARGTQVSTTQSLWLLVREGGTSAGSFFCPSSSDEKDTTEGVTCYWDFTGYNTVSYGLQVAFKQGSGGNPVKFKNEMDSRIAIAADKGPMSQGGSQWGSLSASNQLGQKDLGSPQAALAPSATGPGVGGSGPDDPGRWPDTDDPPSAYGAWNSPNHGGQNEGEGQNVLFPDAHAEWHETPGAGVDNDNIYTVGHTLIGDGAGGNPALSGVLPGQATPTDRPKDRQFDTLIYP